MHLYPKNQKNPKSDAAQKDTPIGRRTLLRGLAATGVGAWLPLHLRAVSSVAAESVSVGGFEAVHAAMPQNPMLAPTPPVAPPAASSAAVYDIFGNHWCLGAADSNGNRPLLVLAAQSPTAWAVDTLSGLPAHPWQFLAADEFGYLWIAAATRCLRLDPHTPQAGWMDLSADLLPPAAPGDRITALGVAASGATLVALRSGALIEIDRDAKTTTVRSAAPTGVEQIACDQAGDLWLRCGATTYRKAAAADAWQRRWELVDRLPAGDHDLSGDVLDGTFYMAGGQNAGWGYPARPHVFDELFAFDPATRRWRVAAKMQQPRYYNGTTWLEGKVWIVGGYTRDAQFNPVLLSSVALWDPGTGVWTAGPYLPQPMENPAALHLRGRIYVAGSATNVKGEHACDLLSIGSGETQWRHEPQGPAYSLALAAAGYNDDLYVALPGHGLGRFDTAKGTWSLAPMAPPVRSPQMAAYEKEIWIMGGRDVERQDQTRIYRPADGSWRSGPELPRPLAWGAAVGLGNRLMVVGGAAGRSYNNRTFYLRRQPLV